MKCLKAIRNAFLYSMSGMNYLLQERAFKQEIILGIALFSCEFFRQSSAIAWIYLLISYMIVLITEALNTAVEATVDRIGLGRNELSKKAKDIGSAAVFLALIHLGIAWFIGWWL